MRTMCVMMGMALFMAVGCSPAVGAADAGGAVTMTRDAKIGADHAAPGPRSCSTKKSPAKGAPSADVIAKYVICDWEKENWPNLYLLDNVQVTAVGAARRYNANEDFNVPDVDVTKPVYSIRGTYDSYQCGNLNRPDGPDFGPDHHPGSNCTVTRGHKGTGGCYMDTFAEWHCSLDDSGAMLGKEEMLQPPPPND